MESVKKVESTGTRAPSNLGLPVNKPGEVKLTAFECGVAGAISSFLSRAVLQPFDLLKIRFQLQVEPTFGKQGGLYHGVFQAMKTVYKQEGIFTLWRGHVSAQLLTVTYGASQFWAYSFFKQQFNSLGYRDQGMIQGACGGMGGFIGTIVSMPFDVARTRIIAQSIPEYRGMFDVWQKMLSKEGFFSLWRGLGPALTMAVPFAAIQFRTYYLLSSLYPTTDTLKEFGALGILLNASKFAICGASSGLCAKLFVYPVDVLKRRMQIRGAEELRHRFGKVIVYKNAFDCIVKLTREESIFGWFKGLWPSLIKSATFSALVFTLYETSCKTIIYTHQFKPTNR